MGGSTISQTEPRLGGLRVQTSSYGNAVPVGYGRFRIGGNLVWYGNFKAIPHKQKQGGKGGGTKVESTSYTYEAAILVCLGHGPANGVLSAWKGKQRLTGETVDGKIRTLTHKVTVPSGGVVTVPESSIYKAHVSAVKPFTPSWDGGDLIEGESFTRSGGTYTFMPFLEGTYVAISYQVQGADTWVSALGQLRLSLATGTLKQGVWSWLQGYKPEEALSYSGFAYLYSQNYELTNAAELHNHNFEVTTRWEIGTVPGRSDPVYDANPAEVVEDALTHTTYGAGWPRSKFHGLDVYAAYCLSHGLWLSPVLSEQRKASEWLQGMLELTNTDVVWSEGVLKFVPLGDQSVTAHGATFTANTTPVYDLTDDDFMPEEGEPPVRIRRHHGMEGSGELAEGDDVGFNVITLEIESRNNAYNLEPVQAQDAAHIEIYGRRVKETLEAHAIKDTEVGGRVAQLKLQAELGKRNVYEFALSWNRGLLEPLDLVTLTESTLGLDRLPVRLLTVEETDDERLMCTAEDAPIGVASAPLYGVQAGQGFEHNYAADPGQITSPTFFEAPVERTTTGLEVWVAVSGASSMWGGCRVWASLDSLNYKEVAVLHGGSRYGTLTAAMAAGAGGSAAVALSGQGGQMLSGDAQDLDALNTLCWAGGTNPEFFAYQAATLTGANAYSLTTLRRGAFGTKTDAKAIGSKFVRVDESIAKSGPLSLDLIGKQIRFKFTSFNVYGGGEQSLADVPEHSYTITGKMVALPPAPVTGLTASIEEFGIRIRVDAHPEPDVNAYQFRVGPVFETAQVVQAAGGTSFLWKVQAVGSYTIWAVAIDTPFRNQSTPVSINFDVPAPVVTSLQARFNGANFVLEWSGQATAHAIAYYQVRDLSDASQAVIARPQDNFLERPAYWGAVRTFGVSAVDVSGNVGDEVTVDLTCYEPGAVQSRRAEVIDNNVLLYWAAPNSGSLPIDRYEVRKGASWAAGTLVGSNGNSTFTAIFEQSSGNYVYWVAAIDKAGNEGTPSSIAATVNQPPDYVLRANYDSLLDGTLSNLYMEGGALLGPVNTTETWAQHFETRGWTTVQDQIDAGSTLYAMPSVTAGYYEEVLDYGTALPPTVITATLTSQVLAGAVTVTPQISYKVAAADPWTNAPAGAASVLAPSFRYVKVRYDLSCTAGANLIKITGINVKLSIKLKSDSGSGVANAGDAGGTQVNFNLTFVDCDTPMVQPNGTSAVLAMVDFLDAPNPTGFKVLLFDRATGARVSGSFGWQARGY